ncbi:MAG: hypothetical protein K6E19_11470 [Lachnospiraceae bacterium]|nr:hypothetical protein [Lachnospiraceae bacterium]
MHYHIRKGKFGKQEQHMERKLLDYINGIWKDAEGLRIDIRRFTMKGNRIVDTEMIKTTAERMVELNTELKGKKIRDFYTSYFYCALAVVSIDFDYFEEESGVGSVFSWDPPYRPGRNMQAVINESVFAHLSYLIYLLSGKWMNYDLHFGVELDESPEEEKERLDDTFAEAEANWEEASRAMAELSDDDHIGPEEAAEMNRAEGARIKALYSGWEDLIANAEKLYKLFDKCYNEDDFWIATEKMASEFLLAEGLCIYADEKKYLDVMVLLNRAGRLLSGYMKEMNE